MIADPISIPACFSSGDRSTDDPTTTSVTRSGQNVIISVYKAKLGNQSRQITITWCRNLLLLHGLSVSISSSLDCEGSTTEYTCKIELKPWYFWRKQGSKRFSLDNGKTVDVFWDLRSAKFSNGETEPSSDFYVAVVHDREVVLLVGDLKNDAYKKTGCRPALYESILMSKKEHIFGKKRFFTKAKFHDKGKFHDIVIVCKNKVNKNNNDDSNNHGSSKNGSVNNCLDPEMEVRIDGNVVIHVKHLQWKFRGNECIHVNKLRVEIYWDVHDWLFSPGLRNALFIFKPIVPLSMLASPVSSLSSPPSLSSTPMSSVTGSSGSSVEGLSGNGSLEFCLFLYAWKVE